MAAPATAAAQALQLAASLRASEALLTKKLATREEELAKLTKQAEQAQMMLRKEQSEKQGLQTKVRALEDQINELRNWQQSPTDFENDVATAIQHAKEADRSQVEELRASPELHVAVSRRNASPGEPDGQRDEDKCSSRRSARTRAQGPDRKRTRQRNPLPLPLQVGEHKARKGAERPFAFRVGASDGPIDVDDEVLY